MTVLPDRACLRRYALPAHFLPELARGTEAGGPPAAPATAPAVGAPVTPAACASDRPPPRRPAEPRKRTG